MSETFLSIALAITSISIVGTPFIYRLATNLNYKKKIKKAVKEFEKSANEKLKEFEQKKAKLENIVNKYDEKFATVHQLFTELSVLTDATQRNTEAYIAARKEFEKNRKILKQQTKK
ncbi:MAG: hypothetical protein L3J56_04260 [Bacteroidales bacterium]|nr:hypothetical protein [Bacteroidales bacterium]